MAKYSYAGEFRNPADGFRCSEVPDANGKWFVEVPIHCECGSECCNRKITGYRPHTNGIRFDEPDEVDEWIDNVAEKFERDYDNYLEENRHAIVQMERYEQWRNEY